MFFSGFFVSHFLSMSGILQVCEKYLSVNKAWMILIDWQINVWVSLCCGLNLITSTLRNLSNSFTNYSHIHIVSVTGMINSSFFAYSKIYVVIVTFCCLLKKLVSWLSLVYDLSNPGMRSPLHPIACRKRRLKGTSGARLVIKNWVPVLLDRLNTPVGLGPLYVEGGENRPTILSCMS
jgi:hypothetical protein